jgi:hypothetical protein
VGYNFDGQKQNMGNLSKIRSLVQAQQMQNSEPHEPENLVQPIPKVLSSNNFKKPLVRGFKVEHNKYLSGHVSDFPKLTKFQNLEPNSDTLELEQPTLDSQPSNSSYQFENTG